MSKDVVWQFDYKAILNTLLQGVV